MGPLVVDTVEDLRNIQRSLWEVSAAGSACSITHGWWTNKGRKSVRDTDEVLLCALLSNQKLFLVSGLFLSLRLLLTKCSYISYTKKTLF